MVRLRIEDLAWQKRMRMSDLAEKSGLKPGTLSEYWHDRVKRLDIATMTKIAKGLGVRFTDLIDDSDTIPQQQKQEGEPIAA